jgi:hypothetical protein
LGFPHFVNGGNPNDYWVTEVTFTNPSSYPVTVWVNFYDDAGKSLFLEVNGVYGTEFPIFIPPYGVREVAATKVTENEISGYIFADSTCQIQAVCAFKRIQNGKVIAVVTAQPEESTSRYTQMANRDLGVALVNMYDKNAVIDIAVGG